MGMNEHLASEVTGAVRMLKGIESRFGPFEDGEGSGNERMAGERALLREQQARHDAADALRKGNDAAADARERGERELGTLRARASRSGVAMSGSRALVDAARSAEAREEEQDVRDEARASAESILQKGRRDADATRISGGLAPRATAIGLGAKLYRNRR